MDKHFWNLVWYKTYADIAADGQQTYLGYLWWFIEPVLQVATYYVVFSVLRKGAGEHFLQFLIIGIFSWRWFSSCVMTSARSISRNSGMMKSVSIFSLFFPAYSIAVSTIRSATIFIIVLILLISTGFIPGSAYSMLPVLLIVQVLLISGVGLLTAAVMPFIPDLAKVMELAMRAGLFISGVFFSVDQIPEPLQAYFLMNPMAFIIQAFREVLMKNTIPDLEHLAIISLCSIAAIIVGYQIIKRNNVVYPKVLA